MVNVNSRSTRGDAILNPRFIRGVIILSRRSNRAFIQKKLTRFIHGASISTVKYKAKLSGFKVKNEYTVDISIRGGFI